MLVDVFSKGITGKVAEAALGKAGITVNKNAIPFDQNPPMVASGIRVGTPAVTTRGMREAEMDTIAELIARALQTPDDDARAGDGSRGSRDAVPEVPAVPGSVGPELAGARPDAGRPRSPLQRRRAAGLRARRRARARDARFRAARGPGARWPRRSRRVFEDGGVLLAEAGTGTGKTLAYLVPAILSRERVLISTGTKNLQEQIYFKDIPALRDALGIPFTATYMKGRANYLCLHKLDQLADGAGPARSHDVFLPIIREWSDAHRDRRSRGARRICRRISRSGTTSRRPPTPASAPSARATTTASSPGCGSAPRRRTWSSSTIICCAPTPRSGRTRSAR